MRHRTKTKKNEPVIGLGTIGRPIIDPAPDRTRTWEDTVAGRSLFRGGNWGMSIGLLVTYAYTSLHDVGYSPLGFFSGDIILVLVIGVALGFAVGAFIGWLIAKRTGRNALPPTSWLEE